MDNIKLVLPGNPQYLQTLRLTTSSIANKLGVDVDLVEDLKVIVSEIFTYLIIDNEVIETEYNLCKEYLLISFNRKIEEKEEGLNNINFELKKQILLSLADELIIEEDKISVKMYK